MFNVVYLLVLIKNGQFFFCMVVCSSEGCDQNFHKKCAYRIPNNCTRLKETDGVSNPPPLTPRPSEVWSGRPLWIDRTLKSRQHVPHTFFVHTIKRPTQCFHCKKMVSSLGLDVEGRQWVLAHHAARRGQGLGLE